MAQASLILASGSPRRRELLSLLGIPFTVDAPQVDEHTDLPPAEAVAALCVRKGQAGSRMHPGQIILAADTLVAVGNRSLGKPADEADARRMLRLLSGRWHQVYTAVCAVSPAGECFSGVDRSDVRFSPLTEAEIDAYVATGEPMDKAGAYALQGLAGAWIEEVRGTPSGVIGLPLPLTRRLLARCGLNLYK